MSLSEFVNRKETDNNSLLEEQELQFKLDGLLQQVNASEFKFYKDILGIADEEKPYMKKVRKQNKGAMNFINRNVPFGGIKKLINNKQYQKAKSIMDEFENTKDTRRQFFHDTYKKEINGVKKKINIYRDEEIKKEDLLRQQKELKKAKERAEEQKRIEQEQKERETMEQEIALKLKAKQELTDSERLYAKQQQLEQQKKEKEEKKRSRNEEITKKRKETTLFNKKEKEIQDLVDEYNTLIAKRKELIGSSDETVNADRERVKIDMEQLLMVAKKHDLDEADLALRVRNYQKYSKLGKNNEK